jgi:hypothetical protein
MVKKLILKGTQEIRKRTAKKPKPDNHVSMKLGEGWHRRNFLTEVIIPSVSAIGANATWNFTSRDRTWWQRIPPTEKYYLALVTTDSARRVLTYTGPFYLSRSALAFARDPALNPGAATLRVRYGELVQLPILAVGYVNRPLSLNLFVQAETTALVPWWSTSLRTPQAVTLNATRYNALAGAANRAFTVQHRGTTALNFDSLNFV